MDEDEQPAYDPDDLIFDDLPPVDYDAIDPADDPRISDGTLAPEHVRARWARESPAFAPMVLDALFRRPSRL